MDARLTFKEHHNRCMKKAKAAKAILRTLTMTYGVLPERVTAVQIACIEAVTLYGCELWCDPIDVGRQDDLQLLQYQQSRSILGTLPTTPWGALIKESGITPVPVILDSRLQRFTARLTNACRNN